MRLISNFHRAFSQPAGGGATPLFSFTDFSGPPSTMHLGGNGSSFADNVIYLTNGMGHEGGAAYYSGGAQVQDIRSFTTDFIFFIPVQLNYGFVFTIQNSTPFTNPDSYGINGAGSSANGLGWGAGGGSGQPALCNSIGIVFSTSPFNNGVTDWYVGPAPVNSVGLYVDGGPAIGANSPAHGFASEVDLQPLGLNLFSGNPMHASITYDGTILTMVLTDTGTGVSTRLWWSVNIPACVGANTGYIGFTSNVPGDSAYKNSLRSWSWSTEIDARLALPTFSVTPGQYASARSVALSGPAGATIYYTTNGKPPTPGGIGTSQYTGTPIAVSSSSIILAVAVKANFTDSFIAQGLYLIQATANPSINFPSGFASAGGLMTLTGNASISIGLINLTDVTNSPTIQDFESAAAWFTALLPVATFTANFTLNPSQQGGTNAGTTNGLCFVVQNYPQTDTGTNLNWNLGNGPYGVVTVSGGPYTLGPPAASCLGYYGIFASIAVAIDLGNATCGLFQNGVEPVCTQSISPIDPTSTTAIVATIVYDGTNLTLKLVQGANTFGPMQLNSGALNLASIVNSSSAYYGITAGTGYSRSTMKIAALTVGP